MWPACRVIVSNDAVYDGARSPRINRYTRDKKTPEHPSASLVDVYQDVGVEVELYYLNQLVLEGREPIFAKVFACMCKELKSENNVINMNWKWV